MFTEKGQIIVAKEDCDKDADEMMEFALEVGAEDISEEEDSYEIITDPDSFNDVEEAFEKAGIPMASAEVTMIPSTTVKLTSAEDIANMNKILETLDEDDDVQNVWHNWEEE